jgi:hypothetical protein
MTSAEQSSEKPNPMKTETIPGPVKGYNIGANGLAVPTYDLPANALVLDSKPKQLQLWEAKELADCEKIISKGREIFEAVGDALLKIRDKRLYRATHATFDSYCEEKWNLGARYARQLANASEVMGNLRAEAGRVIEELDRIHGSDPELPASERQARPLAKLPRPQQRLAWESAKARAKSQGRPVKAQDVEASVRQRLNGAEANGQSKKQTPRPTTTLTTANDQCKSARILEATARTLYEIVIAATSEAVNRKWNEVNENTKAGFRAVAQWHINEMAEAIAQAKHE